MAVLKVLRARPELFFHLSGIRLADFEALVCQLHPIWLAGEAGRLSRKNRQRAIGPSGGAAGSIGCNWQNNCFCA